MLSRTADCLFWLSRYMERAGNIARGLEVAARMASVAGDEAGEEEVWRSLLVAAGCDEGFFGKHDRATQDKVVHWLVFDEDNHSAIASCLAAARSNARSVRTALTVAMWSSLNDSWNELRAMSVDKVEGEKLPGFLEWVRERVLLFNGAAHDTMLRDEAWRFVHLGTMLERADCTARLLDVRHEILAPETDGAVAHAQWQALLRSVSAGRAYQWVYRDRLQPRKIAELLILRPELPRSLMACHSEVAKTLDAIAKGQGGRTGECHRLAGEMQAKLNFGRIDSILAGGLHGFLTELIEHTGRLGTEIEAFYIRH